MIFRRKALVATTQAMMVIWRKSWNNWIFLWLFD